MTALVPTKGHQFLIDFASRFTDGVVHVIISTRSKEPTTFFERRDGFTVLTSGDVRFHHHSDDKAPQTPTSLEDYAFWEYWNKVITNFTGGKSVDYVFASEPYGQKVADMIGATFIPVDIAREVVPVKGSSIRDDIYRHNQSLTDRFRSYITSTIVMFGPESCGKTTMGKLIAGATNGIFAPEWARPFLETVGPNTTAERMQQIVRGQFALEEFIKTSNEMIKILDTDLLTTLGFYRLYNMDVPPELYHMIERAMTSNRLYIVMNDDIPFEADILRYGGDKRESTKQFWIDLLEEFHRTYYVVNSTIKVDQMMEIMNVIDTAMPMPWTTYNSIRSFERD